MGDKSTSRTGARTEEMHEKCLFTSTFEQRRYSTNGSNYYMGGGEGEINQNHWKSPWRSPGPRPRVQPLAQFMEYETQLESTDCWAPPQDDWIQ